MLHLGLATPQPTTAPLNAFPLRSPRAALTKDITRKKLINPPPIRQQMQNKPRPLTRLRVSESRVCWHTLQSESRQGIV